VIDLCASPVLSVIGRASLTSIDASGDESQVSASLYGAAFRGNRMPHFFVAIVVAFRLPLFEIEVTLHATAKTDAIRLAVVRERPRHAAVPTRPKLRNQKNWRKRPARYLPPRAHPLSRYPLHGWVQQLLVRTHGVPPRKPRRARSPESQ